tara:strand:+ start:157 stop:339 length:183 start_codon:yes stop_codon:yes gene_type:complete
METIQTLCGAIIPVSQILEIRPNGDEYRVMTTARNYRVSADVALSLVKKPRKTVTKKAEV